MCLLECEACRDFGFLMSTDTGKFCCHASKERTPTTFKDGIANKAPVPLSPPPPPHFLLLPLPLPLLPAKNNNNNNINIKQQQQ